jgi:ankyrin repeat protein
MPMLKHKVKITALHLAAREGRFKVLKILLNKGARINAQDSSHYTALY